MLRAMAAALNPQRDGDRGNLSHPKEPGPRPRNLGGHGAGLPLLASAC